MTPSPLLSESNPFCVARLCVTHNAERFPSRGILRNQRHPTKVLNSEFHLCPRSKPYLQHCEIDFKDFLTQTAQGINRIKPKIKL